MDEIQDTFQQAFTYHQAGQVAAAEPLYRQVMQHHPNHPDVLYLLGSLYFQCGQYEAASRMLHQAVSVRPDDASAHNNLGSALYNQGQLTSAIASYEQALALNPDYAEAHCNLGIARQALGQTEAAAAHFAQALQLNPDYAEAHNNLGVMQHASGRLEAAVACYRRAVAIKPAYTEAHMNLADTLRVQGRLESAAASYEHVLTLHPAHTHAYYNLGLIRRAQGDLAMAAASFEQALMRHPNNTKAHYHLGLTRYEQGMLTAAAASFERAVALDPDNAEVHHHLGGVLYQQGKCDAALVRYEQALALMPDFAEAHYNLGVLLQAQEQIDAAVTRYERALALQPDYVKAHSNLGTALKRLGHTDAAIASFERVLALEPDNAEAHWNRALLWLTRGDLAQGWAEYEWRFRVPAVSPRVFPQPRWDGTALEGRTILVYAEQGIGDEVLFASCIPELIAKAGHCVIESDPRLVPLFARSFPTTTVYAQQHDQHGLSSHLPAIDVQTPSGSLPRYVRPTLDSFPLHFGYLVPDAQRCAHWMQRVAVLGPGLKVGIAWRSRVSRLHDPYYTRIEEWGPILTTPGVHFVNLQYDQAEAELAAAMQQWNVSIHTFEELDLFHDLDGVAALISVLDLIIAPETIIRILAGSMGQPVWKLTSFEGSWPSLGTAASPWFPSLRVFRQPRLGDWPAVLTRVAQALHQLTITPSSTPGKRTLPDDRQTED